jgi:carbamoyl-phosphate synthase large subunit
MTNKKNEINVLVSSAGRRVELIKCFRSDAAELDIKLRIIATDMHPDLSSGCAAADKSYKVSNCSDPVFLSEMLKICREEKVDLLVPTIDTELLVLSEQRQVFFGFGTEIAISSPNVIKMARDKYKTFQFLTRCNVPCPRTFLMADFSPEQEKSCFPVILKPRGGSSSKGLIRVSSTEDFPILDNPQDYIVQEIFEGEEYTVNLFFDNVGDLITSIPHLRIETRAGEVSKGCTKRVKQFEQISQTIAASLNGFRGVLCYQAIVKPSGETGVFEINARFGGGYPLAHHAGGKFSKWLLEEVSGRISTASKNWKADVQMLRYDAAFFEST